MNIFVDGKFYTGSAKILVVELDLYKGQVLTPQLQGQLADRGLAQRARDYALWLLARYRYSQRKLHQKLTQKYGLDLAGSVTSEIQSMGLLDDRALALSLVEKWSNSGTKSPLEMRGALVVRGINRDDIEAALGGIGTEDRIALIKRLARRKGLTDDGLVDPDRFIKIARYLANKGFGYSEIKRALGGLDSQSE